MVAVPATAGQVRSLANNPSVRSIWMNDKLHYLMAQARVVAGVDRARTAPEFLALDQNQPINGKGNFSLLINDSGIDGTHPDLLFGSHLIQNVQSLQDSVVSGILPALFLENIPDTDTNVGHGTHCAGIASGTGAAASGLYTGVAPGVNLIGYGSGAGLSILDGLGGFEYAIENQVRYNIRIISNSWGGSGAFDPTDPVSIASKAAHDAGIVVLFAAGNSGPTKDTMGPESKAPWVISVAAGTKEGGLASFSSRGLPKAQRAAGDDNAPTITAPGTGREFASDSTRFTSDIVSTRSKTNIFANGELSLADLELSPSILPFYTEISGTSMATPFAAGTVALLLQADPTLTPDQVKAILVQTASQMPGYSEFEVGAGYINVYAAVDRAFHHAKGYGSYSGALDSRTYNLTLNTSTASQAPFHIDFSPVAQPGPTSTNAIAFTVAPGISVLDLFASIDDILGLGEGNTVGLVATDPNGTEYSSGISLPVLDVPNLEILVKNPVAGAWTLEARGIRGTADLPEVSLPLAGVALPGPVDGTITQQVIAVPPIADIQTDPAKSEIEMVLANRMMDVQADQLFHPTAGVTRGDFAATLVQNAALRQSLAAVPRFTDAANASDEALYEAVTASGSTLRDFDYTPTGLMTASGSTFVPGGAVSRLDVAVALVKALGQDAAALALAGSDVSATTGTTTAVLSDESAIPSALRGYVQIALNRGILSASGSPTAPTFNPAAPLTRSDLAYAIDHYRQAFAAGN